MKTLVYALTVIITAILIQPSAFAQEAQETPQAKEYKMRHGGIERTYLLYVPEGIGEDAPLVIVMHGYGGKAEGYRPEMMTVARENGFAVCYPQGEKAPKGKTGWNVGYPPQEGMETDDVDFICDLARHLQKSFGFSRKNTFCSGMSNGGEMCYMIAMQRPEVFTAFASIAGLTMEWAYKELSPRKAVPFMEVHGTSDRTSRWEGDPTNDGGWGRYISVPLAVSNWALQARCTHEETVEMPLLRNQVILHRYMGGEPAWKGGPAIEVRLYEVVGGKHSWALADLDTCREIWNFFSLYLR